MTDNVLESNSNQKTSTNEDTTFAQVVDMSREDFKKYCEGMNATLLLGLRNLLASTYVNVESAKDKVVDMMVKDAKVKEGPVYQKHLQDLYLLLQDLEDKAAYIRALLTTPLN